MNFLTTILCVGLLTFLTSTESSAKDKYGKRSSDSVPTQQSNLTFGMIKSQITKGVTSQADILGIFGPPNIMTKNRSGNEVWTYDRISSESESSSAYGTLIVLGGSKKKSSSTQKTMTVLITFDGQDIVKDYSVMSTQF